MGGATRTCRHENKNSSDRKLRGGRLRAGSLFLAASAFAGSLAVAAGQSPDGSRRTELVRMVRQDCGSCHGMTLRGGLGPPLTADALREKSSESLAATIVLGRPGTAMPPWKAFLTAAEAAWIVRELQLGQISDR